MSRTPHVLIRLLPLIALHGGFCRAAENAATEPAKPISYQDIGPRYEIHGEYGKLYTDFTLKGIVKPPLPKGDDKGMVRIDITHLRGQALEKPRLNVPVRTNSTLPIGSEVELVVREEAKLSFPEGIDDMGSNPDSSHLGKLRCVVSLHERRVVSQKTPAK